MTANCVQAFLSQQLAAGGSSRRRSVPPSLSAEVSQSLNQRWRERPRCPAPPVTPGRRDGVVHAIVGRAARCYLRAQVVQDGRAARLHDFVSRFAGTMRPTNRTAIGSCACHVFPDGTSGSCIQILPSHHRAFHAGAVLSVVNALRFASTRPTAGPSGIDDASARHSHGFCAMLAIPGRRTCLRSRRLHTRLTRDFRRRMLMYRVCATRHILRIARSACRARFQSSPSGHDSSAPHNIASGCCALTLRVSERTPDSRSRGLFSTSRLEDPASLRVAFTEAHARPCLG
jgi:hypothetical protein